MATCYVREQGAIVRRRDQRLLVSKGDETIADIPLHNLDQLVVMGNIELTTPAVALLLQAQVDVVFMTTHGRVRGRLMVNESKFAELRLRQLLVMSDDRRNITLARPTVVGKLTNQRLVLAQRSRMLADSRLHLQISTAIGGIVEMTARSQSEENIDALRGLEGKAAAWYWGGFRLFIPGTWEFKQRIYHPAPDPINALLGFGYALLQKDVLAAVQLVGLDPYLGFFHAIHYGRPSLALDMMEQFRPVVTDWVVLDLIHHNRITPADFVRGKDGRRPFELNDQAVTRVIQAYEERVTSRVRYPFTGEQTTLRRCFELQTRQMARVIKGELPEYRAMVVQ